MRYWRTLSEKKRSRADAGFEEQNRRRIYGRRYGGLTNGIPGVIGRYGHPAEEIETLQKAMQTLSEIQRERLHLYFFEGMTTREIADRQGTNQNAVWKSIQSGVAVLRRFFLSGNYFPMC
mgnify:CR=1 FL=1